jgi:hypothetical protein
MSKTYFFLASISDDGEKLVIVSEAQPSLHFAEKMLMNHDKNKVFVFRSTQKGEFYKKRAPVINVKKTSKWSLNRIENRAKRWRCDLRPYGYIDVLKNAREKGYSDIEIHNRLQTSIDTLIDNLRVKLNQYRSMNSKLNRARKRYWIVLDIYEIRNKRLIQDQLKVG